MKASVMEKDLQCAVLRVDNVVQAAQKKVFKAKLTHELQHKLVGLLSWQRREALPGPRKEVIQISDNVSCSSYTTA